MFTLRSLPSLSKSFVSVCLTLVVGLGASFSLGACADPEPEETCYEEIPPDPDMPELICGTTQADRALLTNGRASNLHSACAPIDECPEYCPADVTNISFVGPDFQEENPGVDYGEVIPLCVELDPAAQQCCFWALMVEPS